MNIPLIMAKTSLLRFHPEWVDGNPPGAPGPIFRTALAEYVVAGLAREISRKLSNRELGSRLLQTAKELATESSRMLPAGFEDGDDICPPWPIPLPRPHGGGDPDPDPHPWLVAGPQPEPWLENSTSSMKDIALAVAIRDLASVTSIAKISASLKEVGETVAKQASGRLYDEYCGTPVKPHVPIPRPKANAA